MFFLRKNTVQNLIEPYDPLWPRLFEQFKTELQQVLKGLAVDIQHVGSTAIFGLNAKPILDIDIILHDKAQLSVVSAQLETLGYFDKGEQGVMGRFAFRSKEKKSPHIHLYVCYADSLALKNHLAFRNALLTNQFLAEQYNQLKMDLVQQKGMTREKYNHQKTEFILSVLQKQGFTDNELKEIKSVN